MTRSIPARPGAAKPKSATYVTVAAAAEQLSVGERTVRRYISQGKLPAYRVGAHLLRLDQADVDALATRLPAAGGDDDAA